MQIICRRYLTITLKISARFTLKEVRCELSSSFGTISGTEKEGILFLEVAVIFKMKKKNESKKASDARIFSQTRRKRPFKNLAIQIVNRESFLVKI